MSDYKKPLIIGASIAAVGKYFFIQLSWDSSSKTMLKKECSNPFPERNLSKSTDNSENKITSS